MLQSATLWNKCPRELFSLHLNDHSMISIFRNQTPSMLLSHQKSIAQRRRKKKREKCAKHTNQKKKTKMYPKTKSIWKEKKMYAKTKATSKEKTEKWIQKEKQKRHSHKTSSIESQIWTIRRNVNQENQQLKRRALRQINHQCLKQLLQQRKGIKRIERWRKAKEHLEKKHKKKLEAYCVGRLQSHFDKVCNNDLPATFSVGQLETKCEHCHAKFFNEELLSDGKAPALSCNHGKIQLPVISHGPEVIHQLLTTKSQVTKSNIVTTLNTINETDKFFTCIYFSVLTKLFEMWMWPPIHELQNMQRFFYRVLIGLTKFDFLFSNLQKFSFSPFTFGFGLKAASPRLFSSKTLYRALIGQTTFAR